jgi:hypothetical protein
MITQEQIQEERESLAALHEDFVHHAALVGEGHSVGSIILALVGASSCIARAADLPPEKWVTLVDTLKDAMVDGWHRRDTANDH